jgi:hypothetical protein
MIIFRRSRMAASFGRFVHCLLFEQALHARARPSFGQLRAFTRADASFVLLPFGSHARSFRVGRGTRSPFPALAPYPCRAPFGCSNTFVLRTEHSRWAFASHACSPFEQLTNLFRIRGHVLIVLIFRRTRSSLRKLEPLSRLSPPHVRLHRSSRSIAAYFGVPLSRLTVRRVSLASLAAHEALNPRSPFGARESMPRARAPVCARRHQKRAPLSRLTSSARASRILGMLAWATSTAILFRGPPLRRSRAPVDAFGRLAFGTLPFRGSYLNSFMRIFRRTRTCRVSMNLLRGSCFRLRAFASFDTHARVALTSDSHATAFQRSIFLRTDRGQASARDFAHGKFTPRTLLSQPPRSLASRDARARGLAARAHLQRIVIEKVWRFRLRIRRPARASEPSIQNPALRMLLSQHPPSANSR